LIPLYAMAKPKKRQDNEDVSANASPDASSDRIAMRAYELYQARGGSDGQAWDDWLTAERELTESQPQPRDDRRE
jgi:hypothetical protein